MLIPPAPMLQLTGFDTSETDLKFDGRDIWPLLTGEQTEPKPITLHFARGNSAAIRHGHWKLVAAGSETQLFNLADDPNEENDLASQRPEKGDELAALLQAEQAKEKEAKLTQPRP